MATKTLEARLKELKSRIDEDYAARIEGATTLRVVDLYEAKATKMLDAIDRVIEWAKTYEVN